MYLRLVIAGSLGLLWYFSDCGRALAQLFIFVLFCISTPLLCSNGGRENSTQTEEETSKHPLLETDEEESSDLIDGGALALSDPLKPCCPDVKRSLQQVFECAYAQLVLPWYEVPEPCEQQPLHQVLSREIDFVIDRIIEKAIDFDICLAVVGSIRIFTQHLHNAKQPDRELLFSSRAEELAVLRELSDTLVRNLFSKPLLGQEVNCCALNEIIALKGLGLLVNWLSDPDNLNQLVVNQLDSVSLKNSAEELHVSDPDEPSLNSQGAEGEEEGGDVSLSGEAASSDCEIKEKTKVNRLKVGWSKFVDKVKSKKAKKKKMKRVEHDLVMRLMAIQNEAANEEDRSSRESSIVGQEESDREDSDLEDYLASVQEDLIEFKLSYEMWRVGHWAVSIPHADWEQEEEEEEKELTFTVHLEEKDSPENLQWDIKKTYMDVVHFRNIWQDSSNISEILDLGECDVNSEIKEEARASVERFLQDLISDDLIGHTQPVFQFLCPLERLLNEEVQSGGVWGLLSGLAYLLTPGHEEEESSSLQTEVPKENTVSSSHPEPTSLSSENHCNSVQNGCAGSPLPSIVVSQYDSPQVPAEAKGDQDPPPAVDSDDSHDSSSQDKPEDSENTFTTHLKTIMKGLTRSRSQESLSSTKSAGNEEASDTASHQEGAETPLSRSSARSHKKERSHFRMAVAGHKSKVKEAPNPPVKGDDSQCQKCPTNWEQLEATKAIFDLLKEISGNSILINFFDAFLKPVMPILKKKINSFLNKVIPSEENMVGYIDILKNKQWPKCPAAVLPPRTKEDKDETRARAHDLINARYSSFIVLKKTDVESVFNLFQDSEENKMLVYRLLSFLLREFLQDEEFPTSAALQKLCTSSN
ncbi:hypothetical protein OJAV_G00102570 [Oryzias javanicus]|uniref:Sorting nexin C-terminal domain-containing protein n=1 Tax=Oryzias javanicus TaxID=123683 RepID=A0A437CXP5_ORYJA|nr:hypothetical protein OJAV_G00102570 [Oryzias javanicus]